MTYPHLLTVIAPRHVARGDEITRAIEASGLKYARRSKHQAINAETQIYLADTMSEMGLFYSLCPIAVIGGSFVPIGGHNPIEAAQFDCAIIFGPHMFKTAGLAQEFLRAQAALQLNNGNEIAFAVDRLLTQPDERKKLAQTARLLADNKRVILDHIVAELSPFLQA
jgi:3-deoxy-D-manno-octulosonic-acid transferase